MNNFEIVFRGYDKDQVKAYLDKIINERVGKKGIGFSAKIESKKEWRLYIALYIEKVG